MKIFRIFIFLTSGLWPLISSSCGGTFTLRPDGSLSYTTKQIIKAPIAKSPVIHPTK